MEKKNKIKEHDIVILKEDLLSVPKGTEGTVIFCYENDEDEEDGYEVEFKVLNDFFSKTVLGKQIEKKEDKVEKVIFTDTFFKSFKKVMDTEKFWKFAFWEDKYYELKNQLWALRKYFNIVRQMRSWDGCYLYQMTKFQLEILLPQIENGNEEEESRDKKVKDIKRLIELLDRQIEDNYNEICGYIYYDYDFEETDNGMMLVDKATEEQQLENFKCIEKAIKMEEEERIEIGTLMAKIPFWWN